MIFKGIVILFLIVILYSLGSGLVFLVRDKSHSNRVVKSLTWRVGLSLLLFILLFIAYAMGWVTPHGM